MKHRLIRFDRGLQQLIDDASIPGSPLHPSVLLNDSARLMTERPEKKRKLDEDTSLAKSQLKEPPALQTTLARHHHLVGSKSTELEEAYSIIKDESNTMVQLTVCLIWRSTALNTHRSQQDRALTWLLVSHW